MKKIRRKLGLFYWKCNGRIKNWWYVCRKNWRRLADWIRGWFCNDTLHCEKLKNVKYLVICAHPDDETIFFSSILKKKKPFVICASNRGNKVRRHEFYSALDSWGVEGTMLNIPDVKGLDFIWRWRTGVALRRIKKYLPSVTVIYTHSEVGETGHPHHYAVNTGVQKIFSQCKIITNAASVPENGAGRLSETDLEEKRIVLKSCYSSQVNILERWCPWWQSYLTTEYFEE